ncbi:MAG: hypothetical protein FJZ47_03710 [Candidatus Tectomicrobia bacterium]|uniref:Uncharacterized protein n=1 Tax=Tectimicrobiota bacterium TaxID=2528274 RepID=A0A938AZR3_UNCTE|nr:hypothetical protein [Candidatus Tectomicrobia bacterium]
MDSLIFILKVVLGTVLFTLILWYAQSRHPRAAGMMLTFPALNGLGLLTAESHDLPLMARAMLPMIALNGCLCTAYIGLQRWLASASPGLPCVGRAWLGVSCGVLLWSGGAYWGAPLLQSALLSSLSMLLFIGLYAIGSTPFVVRLWRLPLDAQSVAGRLPFWTLLHTQWLRVGGVALLLSVVMLVAQYGATAWAGRLSALPLLPFYSLMMLTCPQERQATSVARLVQVGSTALLGPLVAMLCVWGFMHYLLLLPLASTTVSYILLGSGGLLSFWGMSGLLIWGVLKGLEALHAGDPLTKSRWLCNP